jgi:ubiquinone/menaquinone biosynthesis C-methylase UbiE
MELREQREWWDNAAKANAASAVLSNNERWDLAEFYASGAIWFDQARAFASDNGVALEGERALDFGSGLGRMTSAIARHYARAEGADISPEMIARARSYLGAHPHPPTFHLVADYPLPFADGSFDLVYSTIVVQHISPPHNLAFVDEFFRVARRGRFILFDAPDTALPDKDQGNGIFLCPRYGVLRLAERHGAELVAQRDFPATATRHWQYLFRKA